jgi:transcriptional regulator with XRE-family HTH domain
MPSGDDMTDQRTETASESPMASLKNLGPALLVLRQMLGISGGEVARRAGVGKSQLSKYETGKELPKLPSLQKILDIYGVDFAALFVLVRMLDRVSTRRLAIQPALELEVLSQFVTATERDSLSELMAAVVRFSYVNLNTRVQAALGSSRKAPDRGAED